MPGAGVSWLGVVHSGGQEGQMGAVKGLFG